MMGVASVRLSFDRGCARRRATLALALVVAGVGCAGTHPSQSSTGTGTGGTTGGAGGATDAAVIFQHYDGPPTTYDGPAVDMMRVVGSTPLGDAACAAQTQKAQQLPLDMYIMLDSSASMLGNTGTTARSPTKWAAVKGALTTFLNDPKSAGIGVGLQYFPLIKPGIPDSCLVSADCSTAGPCTFQHLMGCAVSAKNCSTNADCPMRGDSCVPAGVCSATAAITLCVPLGANFRGCGDCFGYCDARDVCEIGPYATPAAEVTPLPGAAAGLVASLAAHTPDGRTPTSAALTGAISHAQALSKANAGHRTVVLLATDGLPDECTPSDAAGVASIAASGLGATPSMSTFVIGVFAPDEQAAAQPALNGIASAGGTKQAFIINVQTNVEQSFLAALNSVRSSALACEYKVPTPAAGQNLDYYSVNVQFTSGAGQSVTIGNVKNKAGCDARQGGWYYDVDPASGTPQTISVCDTSCAQLQGDPAGRVDVLLGCKTEIIIP